MNCNKNIYALLLVSSIALPSIAHSQSNESSNGDQKLVVGLGAAGVPEYQGAKKNKTIPIVTIDYENKDGFFMSTTRGIGLAAQYEGVQLSAALAYRPGRQDHKSSVFFGSEELKGMGSTKASITTQFHSSMLTFGLINITADANLAVSNRENGNEYVLGLSMPIYESKKDHLQLSANTTFGDIKFNQANFGVTAAQSKSSHFKEYHPSQGFNKASLALTGVHLIDNNWSIRNTTGIIQTIGDAAESPITKKKTTQFLMVTLNYAF